MKELKLPNGTTIQPPQSPPSKGFYYNAAFANDTKVLLDKLHASKQRIVIPAIDTSVNTIRFQYYQGLSYLVEHCDPDGHYKNLKAKTKLLTFADRIELHIRFVRSTLKEAVVVTEWKEAFESFLETAAANEKFHRTNLALSDDDVAWIQNQLVSLTKENGEPLFYGKFDKNEILLIKDE